MRHLAITVAAHVDILQVASSLESAQLGVTVLRVLPLSRLLFVTVEGDLEVSLSAQDGVLDVRPIEDASPLDGDCATPERYESPPS